ncbi:MAG TPA: zf-HC2 domain-containing protein [Spirochaetales bacterium]|nr:zf-HC2 domain-containing protein [Spirochaetales bacterium]
MKPECREHREKIAQHLLGDLTAEESRSLETHLAACPGCRSELDRYAEVLHRLPAAGDEPDGLFELTAWRAAPDGRTRAVAKRALQPAEIVPLGDVPDAALAAFIPALGPFSFADVDYDPFRSIASSLDRALIRPAVPQLALWAAIEGDLFRFAYDAGFTAALETKRGTAEWARFAALNELYRDLVRAILPFGAAPPGWRPWLTGDGRNGAAARASPAGTASGAAARALARALGRGLSSIRPALMKRAGTANCFTLATIGG